MARCWSIRVFEFGSFNPAINHEDTVRATNHARTFEHGIVPKLIDPVILGNPVDPVASVAAVPYVMASDAQSEAGQDFDSGNNDFDFFSPIETGIVSTCFRTMAAETCFNQFHSLLNYFPWY
jgi:hypothetical protein